MIKKLLHDLFANRDSIFGVVSGFNQSGKTDFVLMLMEKLCEYGYYKYFGMNQEVENAPFEYDYITDLQTLMTRVNMLKKKYLFFFDELGKSAPRAMPWSKLTLELIQKLEVKRKDKLSMIGCSIGDVDRRIVSPNYLDWHILKKSLTTADLYHLQKRYIAYITGIEPTSIKFSEFLTAQFTLKPQINGEPLWVDWEERLDRHKKGEPVNAIWSSRMQKSRDYYKVRDAWLDYRRGNINGSDKQMEQRNTTRPEVSAGETGSNIS